MPLGWQANEDWERGVGFSGDKRYRLIVWRVDFAFEGVNDAEHYAATKAAPSRPASRASRPRPQARRRSFLSSTRTFRAKATHARRVRSGGAEPGKPKEGVLMTLGVPRSDVERGFKLMALLKQS
jgi:hypothetical protein